ncbi:uncharacterized protein TM35_000091620 [Trypanosoma theileri]|uniref:Uncharacterized protein n=1 Tax=Trypanosoma theileri TaxID=67003 RepID=A0A1X0NZK9_9TRYP|nr:uncharacterized protein TM35_000091620 [Trypanosoma theileri]ORC90112.1 hypothetical protein TM35_000091620 [Trypanosoma theileri]
MDAPSKNPMVALCANLNRAEDEMRQLMERVDAGAPMGELLRKKVALQRRIQRLRDEEEELRREEFFQSLVKSNKEKSLVSAKRKEKEMKSVKGKMHKRKPDSVSRKGKQKQVEEQQNKGGDEDESNTRNGDNTNTGDNNNNNNNHNHDDDDKLSANVSAGNFSLPVSSSRQSPTRGYHEKADRWRKNNANSTVHEDSRSDTISECEGNIVEGLESLDINMTANIMQMVQSTQWQALNSNLRSDAARQAREAKLEESKIRQDKLKRRFDIVEGMYTKAIDRRLRAMQRIAADPPADRLIGANALQHIPVGLLPGQLQQTANAIVEGTMLRVKSPTSTGVAATAVPEVPQKGFFITCVDATSTRKIEEGRSGASPTETTSHEKKGDDNNDNDDDNKEEGEEKEGESRLSEDVVSQELLRQWRELGYTAVYLPASKRLVYPNESGRSGRSIIKPYDPNGWMKLDPMPSVHLVQRRLPIEEMLKQHEQQYDVANSVDSHWHLPSLRYGKK